MAVQLPRGVLYEGWKEILELMQKTEKAMRRLVKRDGFPLFHDSAGRVWTTSDAIRRWGQRRAEGQAALAPTGNARKSTPHAG